jgi:hypothetical protein
MISDYSTPSRFSFLRLTNGNPHFSGLTITEIEKSGDVTVRFTRAAQTSFYAGKLTPEEDKAMQALLAEIDPSGMSPSQHTPVAGEEKIVIDLGRDDSIWHGEYWTNEQADRPGLRKLVEFFSRITAEISKNAVQF